MNLFSFESYKLALKAVLNEKREHLSPRYTYQRMAEACGIQKTYLSRVLNNDQAHLSEEQLYRACRFLGLNRRERSYLQSLRLRDRVANDEYRLEIEEDLQQARYAARKTDTYLQVPAESVPVVDQSAYYLNPNIMLTHIFLTIQHFRSHLDGVRDALRMTQQELDEAIQTLEAMGLVQLVDGKLQVRQNRTHLSASSALYKTFRTLQRVKSLEQLGRLDTDKAFSFSVAFSSDPEAREKLHERILQFIAETEELVGGGAEKEVYQLNIDLFDWT